jgi:hypothetical protein
LNRARAGDCAFALRGIVAERIVADSSIAGSSRPTRQGPLSRPTLKAHSQGPFSRPRHHRRFFVSGRFVYLFPHRGQADRAGRQTFCAFGKQLAALLAKILAFQAIILAF